MASKLFSRHALIDAVVEAAVGIKERKLDMLFVSCLISEFRVGTREIYNLCEEIHDSLNELVEEKRALPPFEEWLREETEAANSDDPDSYFEEFAFEILEELANKAASYINNHVLPDCPGEFSFIWEGGYYLVFLPEYERLQRSLAWFFPRKVAMDCQEELIDEIKDWKNDLPTLRQLLAENKDPFDTLVAPYESVVELPKELEEWCSRTFTDMVTEAGCADLISFSLED